MKLNFKTILPLLILCLGNIIGCYYQVAVS
jgi:hypothetical protein